MLDPAAATHSGREAERVAKGRSPAAGWVRRRPWPRIFPSSSPPRHKQCGGFTTALAPAGEGREGGSALGGVGGGGAGREGARHLPAPRTTPTQTARRDAARFVGGANGWLSSPSSPPPRSSSPLHQPIIVGKGFKVFSPSPKPLSADVNSARGAGVRARWCGLGCFFCCFCFAGWLLKLAGLKSKTAVRKLALLVRR